MLFLVLFSMCDGELLSVTHAHINQLSLGGVMKSSISGIVQRLQILGYLTMLLSAGFLAGTFLIESDIYQAFLLGAFFTSLLGIILLFGFSDVIHMLGEIRDQMDRA